MYKPVEEHPEELKISTYWSRNGVMTLRTALPATHEENQWNWFRREYPDLNPTLYGIENPGKACCSCCCHEEEF